MKKIIIALAVIGMIGCKKEEKQPKQENCNCGIIMSDNVSDYSIEVKNDCSNNVKRFYLYEADWMKAHVGNRHCFTNVNSW